MAPRANWKGYLKVAELACQVALYTAASTSERISFHTVNRATGHRVHRQFVDQDTGDVVERDDQVKGYEIGKDEYVILDPEEVASAVPESDKTLSIGAFVACDAIDDVYFDRPYYLAPADAVSAKAYAVIREAMRKRHVAALAQTVLFRRVRTLLIRSYDCGLVATTLNFDYEVRSAEEAFSGIREIRIEGEMLDLARHIIDTKRGKFDPRSFDDRYEAALEELVKAKLEGREIRPKPQPAPAKVVDLLEALRQSAGAGGRPAGKAAPPKKAAPRKAAAKKAAPKKAVSKKAAPKKPAAKRAAAEPARRKAS